MSAYSIKDLERYSGIKAHTLRIWEQRYKLLSPQRSDTNIRTYSNADLRHILNVSFLNNQGHKISNIAKLSVQEIHRKVDEITETNIVADVQIENFIHATADLDEEKFLKVFDVCAQKLGFDKTMTDVIYPFLQKLGVMWHTGVINPGHEHFIVNLIRQKILSAINEIKIGSDKKAKRVILFLPENENHEIALLYYQYHLRSLGYKTFYLGQSMPYDDLKKINKQIQAHYLLTIITCPKEKIDVKSYLKSLAEDFKKSKIMISGYKEALEKIKLPANIFYFKNPKHFSSLLQEK